MSTWVHLARRRVPRKRRWQSYTPLRVRSPLDVAGCPAPTFRPTAHTPAATRRVETSQGVLKALDLPKVLCTPIPPLLGSQNRSLAGAGRLPFRRRSESFPER